MKHSFLCILFGFIMFSCETKDSPEPKFSSTKPNITNEMPIFRKNFQFGKDTQIETILYEVGDIRELQLIEKKLNSKKVVHKSIIRGYVDSVFMTDLNNDKIKEIYVTYHSTDEGNYGNILGITKSRKKNWISIYLPETNPKLTIGYTGHDQFMIDNHTLLRKYKVKNNKFKKKRDTENVITYDLTPNNKLKLKKVIERVKNN